MTCCCPFDVNAFMSYFHSAPNAATSARSGDMDSGTKAVIAVGAVLIVLILAIVIGCYIKKNKKGEKLYLIHLSRIPF